MGNKILDILSKAAEDAVDAAEARKQKQILDSKPTMLNLPPVTMSPSPRQGYAPVPNAYRPIESYKKMRVTPIGESEQKTRLGLTPIQSSPNDVQTLRPDEVTFVMEDASNDVLQLSDANDVDDVAISLPDASADIDLDPNMDISLDIDIDDVEVEPKEDASQAAVETLQNEVMQLKQALEENLAKLASAESRALQLQEKLIRATADYDNYRKRVTRDQEQYKTQAEKQIVNDFLAVQDNFERAIQHAQTANDFDSLMHGVKLTNKMYTAALAKHGCVSFESLGKPFDPNYHDVLSRVEDNTVPNNTIVQEHLKGYMLRGMLLRPALVVVAQSNEPTPDSADASSASLQPDTLSSTSSDIHQ